jgi:hypothetical protein
LIIENAISRFLLLCAQTLTAVVGGHGGGAGGGGGELVVGPAFLDLARAYVFSLCLRQWTSEFIIISYLHEATYSVTYF